MHGGIYMVYTWYCMVLHGIAWWCMVLHGGAFVTDCASLCVSSWSSVVRHVEQVLAIELLAACQGLEFHRPRTTTAPLEDVYKLVRTVVRWAVLF